MSHTTDLTLTLFIILLCVTLGAFSFRKHFAKHDELKPRMVPWIIISLACLATAFMLTVHLVNLLGLKTGGRL